MRKLTVVILLLMAACISCKKDKNDTEPDPVVYDDYMKLKVGNYWVYEQWSVIDDTVQQYQGLDSFYVERDTMIDGNQYFKLMHAENSQPPTLFNLRRDSLHYTLNFNRIIFSSQDFSNNFDTSYLGALSDTFATVITSMANGTSAYTCPAGTFQVLTFLRTYYMHPGWQHNGAIRLVDRHYAKNIGMVYENLGFFLSANAYYCRRLLRYHVE